VELAIGSWDLGVVIVLSTALVWPAGAAVFAASRREAGVRASTVFWRATLTALLVAVLFLAWALVLQTTNGTSQAMASLGPQIAAVTCVIGAVLCGAVALVLRLRG
jgi:anti-sigma-K factor RskA